MTTLHRLMIEDIAGKNLITVDGLNLDMDASARFVKGKYTGIDMTTIDISDIAIMTNEGELLYLESYKLPQAFYAKVEKAVIAIAMTMAEKTPDHEWDMTEVNS